MNASMPTTLQTIEHPVCSIPLGSLDCGVKSKEVEGERGGGKGGRRWRVSGEGGKGGEGRGGRGGRRKDGTRPRALFH